MSHIKSVPQPNPRLGDALFLGSNDQRCIESGMFFGEVDKWFGVTGQAAFAWRNSVKKPIETYKSAARIVNSGSTSHAQIHRSFMAQVYRQEMELAATGDPTTDARTSALISARRRVGVPSPMCDATYRIEALLETIKIRLKLIPVVESFCDQLRPTMTASSYDRLDKRQKRHIFNLQSLTSNFWTLGWTLLSSCRRDIAFTLRVCREAELRRSELITIVLSLQVEFEVYRFEASGQIRGPPLADESRRSYIANANAARRDDAAQMASSASRDVLHRMADHHSGKIWAYSVILPTINQILADWSEFTTSIQTGQVFQPRKSLDETMSLVQAAEKTDVERSGRFYRVSP
jgi:hypothetical protein